MFYLWCFQIPHTADKGLSDCRKRGGHWLLCWISKQVYKKYLLKLRIHSILLLLLTFVILLGSSFMFGRALTSVLWGILADRYGRKPVIIFGTISVLVLWSRVLIIHWYSRFLLIIFASISFDDYRVIFNTLFGLSTSFWMAVSTRFLLGSLCGILGPMRVCWYSSNFIALLQYMILGLKFNPAG